MSDPVLDAKITKLIEAGATDDEIDLFIQEEKAKAPSQDGALSRFFKGTKQGAKNELLKMSETLQSMNPMRDQGLDPRKLAKAAPVGQYLGPKTNEDFGTAGRIGEFAGAVAADLPLNMVAAGSGLANLGKSTVEKVIGTAAKAGTKKAAFAKGALAGLPGQVASGLATTAIVDPEQVATKEGVAKVAALSTVGGLFDGVFGVRAFNAQRNLEVPGVEEFINTIRTAPPGTAKEVRNKIDDFMNQFDKLASADPVAAPPKKVFDLSEKRPMQTYQNLEIPTTNTPRQWEPKKRVIPNSADVQGYAEEIHADMTQRGKMHRKMLTLMDHVKRGTHSKETLEQIPKLQQDFDKLTEKIAIDLGRLGKSAEEVRNLVSGGGPSTKTPRTVINIRGQQEPNFTDPIAPGSKIPSGEKFKVRGQEYESPTRPGSGTQSPYAYIPPEQSIDPLAPVLAPKKLPTPPAWMDENEKAIFNKIDVGNEAAASAMKEERYLLDTFAKRLDYKTTDFLRPVKEASEKAYDYATKFLRVNMRGQQAIDDAIYIPNADGTYARGAESLVPLARRLGGDPESMLRFNMYSQARQAISGVDTPFDVNAATSLVNKYSTEYPEIVQAYEQGHKPLVRSLLDAAHKYGLYTDKQYEELLKVEDYVSLARSVFGDYDSSLGFLRGRKNPESEKLVGDYWLTMSANIRGLVRAGERSNVLRELAKARMQDPTLADVIEIIPYQKPEGFDEIIAKLPKNLPETVKQAFADAYSVPPKGNTFPILIDGQRVSLRLNDELSSSLDMMQFREPKTYNPENVTAFERILTSPANALAKAEKAATGFYSVYRDLFGFGIPMDAAEIAANASARGYKFNLLKDPVRGFFALYRDDPMLKDLAGHGGLKGFRYANPMAEGITQSVEDLQRLGKFSGMKLRLMDPKRAMSEFAGNLSNANSAGFVLANQGRPLDELASAYNNILGDPAQSGAALASLARFTGFMNYPIQATKAQVKALAESPKNLGFFLGRAGGMLTAPTIVMWYLGKDDERLQELAKDPIGRRFMPIPNPMNPDEPFMIPKPQGIAGALFVTLPQMMMEELRDSGRTDVIESVYKAAVQNVMPNVMPMTFNAALGMMTGKTLDPSGIVDGQITRDIVPRGRQGMMAEDAGAAGGSQTSQLLAQLTDVDAGKWERVLRTFMIGTSYDMFRGLENMTLPENAYRPPSQLPMIPIGVRKTDASRAGSRHINEFYDRFNSTQKVLKSMNGAINNGQPERAMEVYGANSGVVQEALKLAAQKQVLDAFNQEINNIKYNEFYSSEEKQEKIKQYQADRVRYAKKFLGKE